jgi:hypothetical protein
MKNQQPELEKPLLIFVDSVARTYNMGSICNSRTLKQSATNLYSASVTRATEFLPATKCIFSNMTIISFGTSAGITEYPAITNTESLDVMPKALPKN